VRTSPHVLIRSGGPVHTFRSETFHLKIFEAKKILKLISVLYQIGAC
jgi:hypothetical protein